MPAHIVSDTLFCKTFIRTSIRASSTALMLVLSLSANAAECVAPPFNPLANWCNGCTYEGVLVARRDKTCERPFRPTVTARVISEISAGRVTQRAKHGRVEMKGNTISYAPSKGYAGNDEFTVRYNYKRGPTDAGNFLVHFSVTVEG